MHTHEVDGTVKIRRSASTRGLSEGRFTARKTQREEQGRTGDDSLHEALTPKGTIARGNIAAPHNALATKVARTPVAEQLGMTFAGLRSAMGAATLEKKEKRRQWPLATSFGCAAMLLLVGACARAGDSEAIASSDGGTDANAGSGHAPMDANSASPGKTSSGVENGSLSAADVGLQGDAAREAESESSTHGANEDEVDGASATVDATDGGDVMADTDAAAIVDATDAMVGGGDDLSLPCPQTCTSGCCNQSGTCLDGLTDEACGGGGNACQDCSPAGQTCQSNACQAPPPPSPTPPPPDAGGPTCEVSSCSNLCVPYFVPCCKSDSTCGCALLFPRGPCI